MRKRILLCLLALTWLMACPVLSQAQKRVYRVGEADAVPFAEDAETFDLYVCPILGADSMVITTQGQTMLVDMGANTAYSAIRGILERLGSERIDIAFNSHPHNDHLGSMEQILKNYPVTTFMTAFPEDYTGPAVIQKAAIKALRAAQVPIVTVKDGDTFTLGDAKMTVIRQEIYDGANRLSAMLRIEYGDCKLLLTGDVEGLAQTCLAEANDLSADIFKYPHHGLDRMDPAFLEAIGAEYAFIPHGYLNTKDAQAQLKEAGIAHDFATWGVIHLSTNGEYWLVEQELTEDGKRYEKKYR